MPVQWTFRKWLAVTHDIYRVSDLRRRILEVTGVDLSSPALSAMWKDSPRALRMSTVEVICATFQCRLNEFFDVTPAPARKRPPHRLYPGHGRRRKVAAVADFPSPDSFPAPTAPKARRGR